MLCLLSTAPAFLDSCRRADIGQEDWNWEDIGLSTDSTSFNITIATDNRITDSCPGQVGSLDLLVYDMEGVKKLVMAKRLEIIPDSVSFWCPRGEKTVVAIANSNAKLNLSALDKYDSVELLSFCCRDENPERPLMSGTCITAGCQGRIILKPLLSRIVLREVTNNLGGYVRLEDPRAYLLNRNSRAELLRESGFRPSELETDTLKVPLPCDVGIFTQNPGTELFCYPNDSEEPTIGTPATSMVLECEVRGITRRFELPISPIRRNSTTYVEIKVESAEEWTGKFY